MVNILENKKVLLRERKRHTARHVVSTPSVVLPGYPPRGGYPVRYPPGGVPGQVPPRGVYLVRYPDPPGGVYPVRYPPRGGGYPVRSPPGGLPGQVPPGGVPGQVPPPGGYLVRYPDPPPGGATQSGTPPGGTQSGTPPPLPHAFWEMLQSIMGYGYPPLWTDRWMDGRTDACQNITFPRTPYAGGNN